ncbi:solute carrier family 2, facilitated glucose transporter member 8-like isoform X3 [Homalodisca vitripennis]|nr:solute carrier family 2, facilitated glucose transporter member 8-like isoform X3 [Homalodisca vitripennis]
MEEVRYDFTVKTSRRNLYLAVLIAYLGPVATGFVLGWSSPYLVQLEAPNSEFPVTKSQGAWLASLLPLGTVFGPFVCGWLLDSVGRRQTILLYLLMILAGWGLMSTWSIWLMYLGRLLSGIAYGISIAVTSIYIGEISENSVRAMLNTMFPIFSRTPLLISYTLGPQIPYHGFIFLSCLPVILFLLMYNKMPETPHFLLLKNREDEATEALSCLRQLPEAFISKEINEIRGCFAYLTYQCENGNNSILVQWGVLLSLATYIIVCSCGLSSISMSLIGEYFPSHLKAKGSTVATFFFCGAAFLSTNLFPDAVSSFGLSRTC